MIRLLYLGYRLAGEFSSEFASALPAARIG
jgi:hypothetical protein